jgi:nucleoside 2-deoxyribosyltransferase
MAIKAYLAGPDVFLPTARENARRKAEICIGFGIVGCQPEAGDVQMLPPAEAWQTIFRTNLALMESCDIVIANLTPFRGASADAGTLIEVGWFFGRRRPVFGYSNSAKLFTERSHLQIQATPDPLPGLSVEEFGLPDNLMVEGAILEGGAYPVVCPSDNQDHPFDALDVFGRCVEIAAWKLGLCPAPVWAAP